MMKWFLPVLAWLAVVGSVLAQPAAPPSGQQTPIITYCWNGTAMAVCGSPGTTTPPLAYLPSTSASVGTTSAQLVAGGTYARSLCITTKPSDTGNVWLGLGGAAAVVGAGDLAQGGGGSFCFGGPGAPIPTGAINAITDGAVAQTIALAGG
jgi:hypothetical protein